MFFFSRLTYYFLSGKVRVESAKGMIEMKRTPEEAAACLIGLHQEEDADGNKRLKFSITMKGLLRITGTQSLWPQYRVGLENALLNRNYMLLDLGAKFQIVGMGSFRKLRKLPRSHLDAVLAENPKLPPAEVLRKLFEMAFNARRRGPFYGAPKDIADLCEVGALSTPVIENLADELNALSLAGGKKAEKQGYFLVDCREFLAVMEMKILWRVPNISYEEIDDFLK